MSGRPRGDLRARRDAAGPGAAAGTGPPRASADTRGRRPGSRRTPIQTRREAPRSRRKPGRAGRDTRRGARGSSAPPSRRSTPARAAGESRSTSPGERTRAAGRPGAAPPPARNGSTAGAVRSSQPLAPPCARGSPERRRRRGSGSSSSPSPSAKQGSTAAAPGKRCRSARGPPPSAAPFPPGEKDRSREAARRAPVWAKQTDGQEKVPPPPSRNTRQGAAAQAETRGRSLTRLPVAAIVLYDDSRSFAEPVLSEAEGLRMTAGAGFARHPQRQIQ